MIVWYDVTQSHLQNIQIVQNTTLKVIYNKLRLTLNNQFYTEAKEASNNKTFMFKTNLYNSREDINIVQQIIHQHNKRTSNLLFPSVSTCLKGYLITGLKLYVVISSSLYTKFN